MSGTDIFIAIVCALMFFGGMYLNIISRKLSNEYFDSHKAEPVMQKTDLQKGNKFQKK